MTQALTNKNKPGGGLAGGAGFGGRMKKTQQVTAYHVGDDGDLEPGLPHSYTVLTTGQFSGTTALDNPHYAAATLTFAAADDSITDAAAGLVTFLSGDTIVIHGSTANDGVYTIAAGTGGVAGHFHTNEPLADEAAGAYITISKQANEVNGCVIDNVTGLMWQRQGPGTTGVKIGPASGGLLNWYDTATCFTLHPAAGDLQMLVDRIKIVGGAAELPRYFAGQILDCSGFANAVNNLPGYRVTSVAVNGADLDIFLWDGNNTLIVEAAGGNRDIRVVCQSIFTYCASANAANWAGYSDWRIPTYPELIGLMDLEAATAYPDAVAFPAMYAYIWSSTTKVNTVANAFLVYYSNGAGADDVKTQIGYVSCLLVRG